MWNVVACYSHTFLTQHPTVHPEGGRVCTKIFRELRGGPLGLHRGRMSEGSFPVALSSPLAAMLNVCARVRSTTGSTSFISWTPCARHLYWPSHIRTQQGYFAVAQGPPHFMSIMLRGTWGGLSSWWYRRVGKGYRTCSARPRYGKGRRVHLHAQRKLTLCPLDTGKLASQTHHRPSSRGRRAGPTDKPSPKHTRCSR